MPFTVVNTIYLKGLDFGEHLLGGLEVQLLNRPARAEMDLIAAAGDADAVIASGPVQPWSAEVLGALKRCRIVASLGVGYDRVDLKAASRCGIVVTNVPDYCIDEVSSHTIALVMALGRQLFTTDRAVRQRPVNFVPPNRAGIGQYLQPVLRLQNATVGILGFGRIGTATALKAHGLGMRVIACDPHVFAPVIESHHAAAVDFDTLLAQSDFLCINADLNPETRGLFGETAFNRMKPSAYLINTARGEIVDETALIRALNAGTIAGAGLDVTHADPVGTEDPLLSAPNVILTGHSAWYSASSDSGPGLWHRAMSQVAAALDGVWPIYAVNPEVKPLWLARWGR